MTRRQGGITLVEVLVGTVVLLLLGAAMAGVLAGLARASVLQPQSVDEQQRLRGALDQLGGWLGTAGRGLGGVGVNESVMLVPTLYPQRRGVRQADPDSSAFTDRLTMVAAADPIAVVPLSMSMTTRAEPIAIDESSCGPGRAACGLLVGSSALVADARAVGEWFQVTAAGPGAIAHDPALLGTAYLAEQGAILAAVDVRALAFDPARRQLRLATPGVELPLLDGVAAFDVRWFGDPNPPRGPRAAGGLANCVVRPDGTPALATLPATEGAWAELNAEQLSDGPWCGQAPWRFDADLFRVRFLRLRLRLERVRLPGPAAAGGPEPEVEIGVAPRNLLWRGR